MIDKKTIEVALKLRDQFSGALKSVAGKAKTGLKGVEEQSKKTNKEVGGLNKSLMGVVKTLGGMIIAQQVGRWLVGAAQAAENYNRQLRALEFQTGRVGISAKKLVADLQRVTKGQVAMADLVASSNRAIALIGTQSIPQLDKLASSAMKAAQVMGISVTQAMENLAVGIGRQSRLILDNLGVIISVTTANEKYAKSLGKTAEELTEVEKKTAFMLEVTSQLDSKFKELDVTLSATDGATAAFKDMKREVGEGLLPAYTNMLGVLLGIIEAHKMIPKLSKFDLAFDPFTPGGIKITGVKKGAFEEFVSVTERERQAAERKQSMFFRAPFVDKAQIQLVDDLTFKLKALKETARLLADPEIKALVKQIEAYQDQLNPTIAKTDKLSSSMSLYWDRVIAVEKAETRLNETRRKGLEIFKGVQDAYETAPLANFRLTDFGGKMIGESSIEFMQRLRGTGPGKGFDLSKALGLGAGTGQTAGQIGEDFLKSPAGISSLLGSGISGAMSGGTTGAISSLLPVIGSAFGPIGSGIGSLLGGVVGLFGKKRRGETPAEPVYTSDVNLQNTMSELLNAVKSQLVVQSAGGLQRISDQLRSQALAAAYS